ncbi:MAG: hypothetical protein ACRD4R_00630 [Candidatus Acidiferrales bacterium]
MKPIDYAKAAGMAALVLILDLLIAFGVVYVYALFFNPGHPRAYYATAGIPVARWSTRTAGTALMFGAAWLCGSRNPNRNAYGFALALTGFYALLDSASGGFVGVFTLSFALTIGLKLAGSSAGAFAAVRNRRAFQMERKAPA